MHRYNAQGMQQLVDNRYQLGRPLGSGGMADVFLAHDNILDRDVALKVMSDRYANDEEFIERFKREAQAAAALSHPNIVSIYDRGESGESSNGGPSEAGGTYYIAMEYLPGGTLKDRIIKRGAIPSQVAAEVTHQIAAALRAAHRRGVVHRDIKPHNILITDSGDVKVTDFGIARAATSSTMTKTGAVMGTAHYISPEQAMGEPVGPESDLYSLGVVFYEMLTGRLPFDADTPIGIALKHVNGYLRPPREVNPEIPEGINAITCRLLAKDPADRYASAGQLIQDLDRVSRGAEPMEETTRVMSQIVSPDEKTLLSTPRGSQNRALQYQTAYRRTEKKKKRGRWIRLIPLLLLLLALAAVAAYGLMGNPFEERLAPINTPSLQAPGGSPPTLVDVPDLTGMTLDEAEREVGDDFEIKEEDRVDSTKPVGTILSQDPRASLGKAKKGSEISVVVSGTQVADVPDVVGNPQADAERSLSGAGFEVKVREEESPASQEGLVTGQDPGAGEKIESGDEVEITVGTGPDLVEVPDLYGTTPAKAEKILADADLDLGAQVPQPSSEVAEGAIFYQNLPAGQGVEPGSSVNVSVSTGPPEVEVPNVVGLDVATAQQEMESAGLTQTAVEVESDEPAGTVIATDPGAGVSLEPESTVTISYSTGPSPDPASSASPAPAPEPAPDAEPRAAPRGGPPPAGDNSNSGPGRGQSPDGGARGGAGERGDLIDNPLRGTGIED